MKPNYLGLVQAARADIVGRGLDVDASECNRFEVLKRAASIIARVDPDVGLLSKPTGNNCEGYAVDVLCWKDGIIVDCLGAGRDGPCTALWQENPNPVDPGRWRPPVLEREQPAPVPAPPAAPPDVPDTPPIRAPLPPVPPPPATPQPRGFLSALLSLVRWWRPAPRTATQPLWPRRALAVVVPGVAGALVTLDRFHGITNADGYICFPTVPASVTRTTLSVTASGYKPYVVRVDVPADDRNYNLMVTGAPANGPDQIALPAIIRE
jgi:hypothetical protein